MNHNSAPIALFDSGLGGLTVLKALALALPHENFVYLGDTARLPYGSKTPQTIRRYGEQILRVLLQRYGPKAFVIACNSASTQFPEGEWEGRPLFNVIDPGVEAALQATENGRIGVLGTRTTVQSGEYEKRIKKAAAAAGRTVECFSQPCPLLVPLAEEGWIDDPITNLIAHRYLQPLMEKGVDTVILGCTHFPILLPSIRKSASGRALVECGPTLAERMKAHFPPSPQSLESGEVRIVLTDSSERSQALSRELLKPIEVDEYSWIDIGPP